MLSNEEWKSHQSSEEFRPRALSPMDGSHHGAEEEWEKSSLEEGGWTDHNSHFPSSLSCWEQKGREKSWEGEKSAVKLSPGRRERLGEGALKT